MNINGEPTRNDKTLNGETSLGDSTADDLIISGDLTVGGTSSFDGQLDMNNAKIVNLGTPTNSADATTKAYVDSVIPDVTGFLKTDGTNSMSADLNVGSNQIKNVSNGTSSSDGVNLSQLTAVITDVNTNTAAIALNTAKVGITPTQAAEITANTAKVGITPTQASKITDNETAIDSLVNVTNTQTTNIAANASAISTIQGDYFKKDGTVAASGNFNLNGNKITSLGAPTADTDASTKKYVDDEVSAVSSPWTDTGGTDVYITGKLVGIINTTPQFNLDVLGDMRVSNQTIAGDYGFVAKSSGEIKTYNTVGINSSVNRLELKQNSVLPAGSHPNPPYHTKLNISQYTRNTSYAAAISQSAVWAINVSNENGSFASWQNQSSILNLMNEGGSIVINAQGAGHQNNNYRIRCYGNAGGSSGWAIYSDDRIKYHEQNITGALATLNKLKAQKYEKITESLDYRGKWIPSDAEWDSVKNSYDSSGRRLYEYIEEIGFIAQDVRKIPDLSFCVRGEEVDDEGDETTLMMNYNDIFALSIQAIQELDAKRKEDASTILRMGTELQGNTKRILDLNKRLLVLEEKLKNVETNTSKEYIL